MTKVMLGIAMIMVGRLLGGLDLATRTILWHLISEVNMFENIPSVRY